MHLRQEFSEHRIQKIRGIFLVKWSEHAIKVISFEMGVTDFVKQLWHAFNEQKVSKVRLFNDFTRRREYHVSRSILAFSLTTINRLSYQDHQQKAKRDLLQTQQWEMHFYWKSKHQRDCWDCISLILYMHHTINQREKWPKSSHFGNSVYLSILLVSFSTFVAAVFLVFSTTFKLNLAVVWHISCSNTIQRGFYVKFCLSHM